MQRSRYTLVIAFLALAGAVMSGYLTWYDIITPRGVCTAGGFFGCSEVLTSSYSRIGNIPVAFLGLLWFLVAIWLTIRVMREESWVKYLLAWSLVGTPGIVVLVYLEIFVIRAFCPLCSSAHALGIGILVLTVAMWRAML